MAKTYIRLTDLEVYQLARELSTEAWKIYQRMDWQVKKTMGDQFLTAVDSVGANIAEGYGRFHYLDKIKFYYNARGSLIEALEHWLGLLHERGIITEAEFNTISSIAEKLSLKLNNFIKTTYQSKDKDPK